MLIETIEQLDALPDLSAIAAIHGGLVDVAQKLGTDWYIPARVAPVTAAELMRAKEEGVEIRLLHSRRYDETDVEKVAKVLAVRMGTEPTAWTVWADDARAALNALEATP